ncbi:MAG TPA: AraC family transcriptional regulator [Acidimicrobiales bacterium]|nr:AraC family transcriptional regulator [Acidimicrobiales bacterium]
MARAAKTSTAGAAPSVHMYTERLILHQRDVVASSEMWRHDVQQLPHAHEFMEIVVVKSGTAVHRTRTGAHRIASGSVLLIRPGQWHAYDTPEDFQIWNLYVPYKTLATELAALRAYPVLGAVVSASGTAGGAIDSRAVPDGSTNVLVDQHRGLAELSAIEPHLVELAKPPERTGRSLSRLGHLLSVLDVLAPILVPADAVRARYAVHPAVTAASELLDSAPEYPWTLPELAERAHISAAYLCRLFTRELGVSPLRYLERHRLEFTAHLLFEGQLSMGEISSTAGWSDSNYMTRRFRAAYGMSPTHYRETFQRRRR